MIELRDVHKAFGAQRVLDGISFQVPDGQCLAIMGPSGSGKSVMLKHIIGLLQPDQGEVLVAQQSVPDLKPRQLRELRRSMGYLFQFGALINWLTVFENVALPLRETTRMSATEVEERVREVLSWVQLEHALPKYPNEISGGMQKRVGLARALVTEPNIILYDEPEAGLDPGMSAAITELIRRLKDERGMTSVVVTHSIDCARGVGDQMVLFDQGRIQVSGTVDEVLHSEHESAQAFFRHRAF